MSTTRAFVPCFVAAAIAACSPRPDPADDTTPPETDPLDTDALDDTDPPSPDDTDRPPPTGERVAHADGGVYDTTGVYQRILREPIVCYLVQELGLDTRFNVIAVGIEQQLVHIVARDYVWSHSPVAGYLPYARIDLNFENTTLLVGGREGTQLVDLISGQSEALRTEQTDHAAWIGDGMLLHDSLYESVAAARGGIATPFRDVRRYTAGYLDRLYGSRGDDVHRESLDGGPDRTTHHIPTIVFRDGGGFEQFDVVEQYVVLWARRDDAHFELVKIDGARSRELSSFRPILDGAITGVACAPGDAR